MRKIRLICVPPDDASFDVTAHQLFDALAKTAGTDDALAADLVLGLRDRYPTAKIRSRDPIAAYADEPETWYVFRDGAPFRHRG